jgi:hypothetical protein
MPATLDTTRSHGSRFRSVHPIPPDAGEGQLRGVPRRRPPAELAAPAIARLFPHAPSGDPTAVLLYCSGRAALGELPRQTQWQWDGTVRT